MNQRERLLAILVGGLIAVLGLQWVFNKYKDAKTARENRIVALENATMQANEKLLLAAKAERQMGEYRVRSLPGDAESAKAAYQSWLLDLVTESGLSGTDVKFVQASPSGELFKRYRFRVSGTAGLPETIKLLHTFYLKDYLHRIATMDIKPTRANQLKTDLVVDVIGLNSVPNDTKPPATESWQVDPSMVAYNDSILNRNFFEPPNKAPKLSGNSRIEGIVGASSTASLKFEDPEGHRLRYEIADDAPDFVKLDEKSGSLQLSPKEKGDFKFNMRVFDSGYPSRMTEQLISLKVSDPPPPEKKPDPVPEFDDSRQTVLTGLVQGRDDWTAWMNVRTRGKTLKLKVDDEFEIGTLKGKIIEVTPKFAVIEIDDRRFTLRQGGNLAEAAKQALED